MPIMMFAWSRGMRAGLVLIFIVLLGACTAVTTTTNTVARTSKTIIPTTTTVRSLGRSVPTGLWVPRIEARSSLVSLGLNKDGTVEVPPLTRPMQAGWYSFGPTPGEVGPAVILGHVDGYHRPGVFYRLHELAPGDIVSISRTDRSVIRFVVRRVAQISKTRFPTDSVYGDTPGPELRLITCGGRFDRAAHSYVDNIIVYAALG